jgi:hypothetical protein
MEGVGKSSLGRVLDPSALDACPGPRARLRIAVPAAWLAEGAELAVAAPARLSCARCDGGGCDACSRSGALAAPADAEARVVHVTLPSLPADEEPREIALRIPRPFGADHEVAQLLLEVRAAPAPSAGVTRLGSLVAAAPAEATSSRLARRAPAAEIPWPMIAAGVVAAILFALFGR